MAVEHYEQLGAETKRVLSAKNWTLRQAEIRTRIGFSTIHKMTEGRRPRPETLIAWALAVGEDPSYWLELSGYSELKDQLMVMVAALAHDAGHLQHQDIQPSNLILPEDLRDIHELHGRLLDKIKYLNGAEYDRYVDVLRLQQEALLASVEERLKGTESAA